MVTIATGNRLREIRERHGIQIPALATASAVSERVIKRIEEVDGTPHLEIKVRLVTALNTLVGQQRYRTDEVFAGWHEHRRHLKR